MLNIVYSRNCVYQTAYHMVWCPQYRKSVLRGGVAQSLRELLESICAERKYEILSLEIQPDHLHLFVSFPPSVSIADAVRVLKGASARMLLMRHPELKNEHWAGHLWSLSYYVGTAGSVSAETIKSYIERLNTSADGVRRVEGSGKCVRTACVRLELLDPAAHEKLAATQRLYAQVCNFVVPTVAADRTKRLWQRFTLHHAVYDKIKAKFPDLGSQYACNVIRSVSAAYKTELAKHPAQLKSEDKKLKTLVFRHPSVHVDKNTLTFFPDGTVSISTISGRIRARLCPGPFQKELLASGKRKECNLVLHPRRGRKEAFWELHIAVESQGCSGEEHLKNLKADEIMGIDVGENNIAAVSTGRIWKAGALKDKRDRYMSQRKRLQRNGSQSARQHLKKASGRERRHVTHVNNVVSKEIVQEAAKRGIKLIALEDLTHIRDHIKAGKRIRSRLHRWSFRELQEMIVYKAAAAGIRCVFLDPRYTSQTCSQCGAPGKRHKHGFRCSQCGHLAHSDLNASRNLQGLCRQLSAQGLM